jgi:hypothetical protein
MGKSAQALATVLLGVLGVLLLGMAASAALQTWRERA